MPTTYYPGHQPLQAKPCVVSGVNESHPLARGLVGAWLLNGRAVIHNLARAYPGGAATNQRYHRVNSTHIPTLTGQMGWTFSGTGGQSILDNINKTYDFTDGTSDLAFTVAFWMRRNGGSDAQCIIGKWDAGLPKRQWEIGLDSPVGCLVGTDVIYVTLYDESVDGYIGTYGPSPPNLDWAFIVVTYDGGGTVGGLRIYRDGIRIDDTTYENAAYVEMEPYGGSLVWGINNSTPEAGFVGQLDCTFIWRGRALNQAEVEQLSQAPYELLRTSANLSMFTDTKIPGIVQLRGLGSFRSEAIVQARPETRYMGTLGIVQARGLGTERAEGIVQARAEESQRAEGIVQARNLERVAASGIVQARFNSMQRAQATVQARFLETIRAQAYTVLRSRGEQKIREGYEVWVDGAYAGFIDATASPLELTGVAMALGTHDVEIRPSRHFWAPRSPEWVWKGEVDAGGNLVAAVPDEIQNLRYTILFSTGTDNVQLDWFYETRFGCIDPTEFAIWTGPASPVDVSGAAVETVTYIGDGAYWAFIDLTVTTWVAVRARTATANGPVSEIQVVFPSAPTSPPNQWAEPPPPNYPIQP